MNKFLTFILVSLSFQLAFAEDPNLKRYDQGSGGYGLPYDRTSTCADCEAHQSGRAIVETTDYSMYLAGSEAPKAVPEAGQGRGADGTPKK